MKDIKNVLKHITPENWQDTLLSYGYSYKYNMGSTQCYFIDSNNVGSVGVYNDRTFTQILRETNDKEGYLEELKHFNSAGNLVEHCLRANYDNIVETFV